MNEQDAFMEMYWHGEMKMFREHRVQVPIFLLLEKSSGLGSNLGIQSDRLATNRPRVS